MLRYLLYLALATGLACPVMADEMFVSAAASLADALKDLAARFEKQMGTRIVLNFAASTLLARQIEENAPVDVFISADEAQMDRVQKHIAAETRSDLLTNKLVVIVRKDFALHFDNLGDLATPGCRRIALADPKAVPAGVYARQVLTRAGLWEKVESKIVPTENVRATLAVVEVGNADAGFVYKTDAMTSHLVRLGLEIPTVLSPRIVYPVAILGSSTHRDEAARFLAYLKSLEAVEVFERLGFGMAK